ncbi:MAG TPA: hypothetical protein VHD90_07590, partial [Phototrophicaceae bacterium]|nr:hypothetical protein [Phototrophicaceae bacterium]
AAGIHGVENVFAQLRVNAAQSQATSPYGNAIDAGLSQSVALSLQQFYSSYQNPNAGVARGQNLFIPQYATGGVALGLARVNENGTEAGYGLQSGQLRFFKEPTLVLNAQQTKGLLSPQQGLVINLGGVHGTNYSKQDIIDMVSDELDATLEQAGWD